MKLSFPLCRVQKDQKKNVTVFHLCEIDFVYPNFTDEESKVQRNEITNYSMSHNQCEAQLEHLYIESYIQNPNCLSDIVRPEWGQLSIHR